jgi:hypothetical protein
MVRPAHETINFGNLFTIPEQVQAFAQSRKTGQIVVLNSRTPACLFLEEGEIVHAELAGHEGVDAAIALINLPDAVTEFRIGVNSPKHTIRMPHVQILCEAARQNDESAAQAHLNGNAVPVIEAPDDMSMGAPVGEPSIRIFIRNREKTYVLKPGLVYVGRTSNNDIVIPDPTVSAHHASIERTSQGIILRDLDSRNGTYLRGMRVRECWLGEHDELAFGSVKAVFIRPATAAAA